MPHKQPNRDLRSDTRSMNFHPLPSNLQQASLLCNGCVASKLGEKPKTKWHLIRQSLHSLGYPRRWQTSTPCPFGDPRDAIDKRKRVTSSNASVGKA